MADALLMVNLGRNEFACLGGAAAGHDLEEELPA